MLRSFRVANHKSIREEQELMLMPAYDKSRPVVPVAAVFGANASGKSNLLDALRFMQTAVRTSYAQWEPGTGVPRTPFKLDEGSRDQSSFYAVEVVLDEVRYSYGFEVDDQRVREEWLHAYPHGRKRVVFEREGDKIRLGTTMADSRGRAEVLTDLTRANALFLSVLAANDIADVTDLYQWFRAGLVFPDGSHVSETSLREWFGGEDREAIVDLVRAADLGIRDITTVGQHEETAIAVMLVSSMLETGLSLTAEERKKLILRISPEIASDQSFRRTLLDSMEGQAPARLLFHHGSGGVPLTLQDQSAGTRSWMHLVFHTFEVLRDGAVLVVDEVDASLHPHLTARLINLFRDMEINHSGAQLVLTTHDATLLDEEILSRDEIWFVEKDADSGASRIYPLSDFRPRKNENREGRYLAGSYGAVPSLADYRFRRALTHGQESDAAA